MSAARVFGSVLAGVLVLSGAANAREDRSWHLLTRRGTGEIVDLRHGLTRAECEFVMHRVRGEPATKQEIADDQRRRAQEMALEKAFEARWAQWQSDHHCKPSWDTWGRWESKKNEDGTCTRGGDMLPEPLSPRYTFGDSSTISQAECFQ